MSSSSLSDDDMSAVRRARTYLLRVAKPPARALSVFIAVHGPVEAAERVRSQHVPESVAHETAQRHWIDLVDVDITAAAEADARLVVPEDDEWPTRLVASLEQAAVTLSWATPPIALWVRSTTPLRDALDNAVTVVGARTASGYGVHVAAEVALSLATAGITTVSGLSYGVDTAAHRAALSTSPALTAAVLPAGITEPYPVGNSSLFEEIGESGVLLTEYPPDVPPARKRFLARNRLLAALSHGIVVAEAGIRSGSVHAAHAAHALGRPVMAVPGPITSVGSAGCHQLIRDGIATLVRSGADITAVVAPLQENAAPR